MLRRYAGAAALAVLILTAGKVSRSQATAPRQWEYAEITEGTEGMQNEAGFSTATICRATPRGCQEQEVTADLKDLSRPASGPIAAAALMGTQGWELVSATVTNGGRTHLYLRRPKEDGK